MLDGANLGKRVVLGRTQLYCKACHRYSVNSVGVALSEGQVERQEEKSHRKAADRADAMIERGRGDNALNYMRLGKRADQAAQALQKQLDGNEPNCVGKPGAFVDYPEDDPPTPTEAYVLCKACPVLFECARFASAYKPTFGVWGGEVYVDGKPVRN